MDFTNVLEAKLVVCPCGATVGSFTEIDPYTKRVMVELREETYRNQKTARFIWTNHRCSHWHGPLFMSNGVPVAPDIPEVAVKEMGRLSFKIYL